MASHLAAVRPHGSGQRTGLIPVLAVLIAASLAACAGNAPDAGPAVRPQGPVEIRGAGELTGFPAQVGRFQRVGVLSYPPSERDFSVAYNITDPRFPVSSTIYIFAAEEIRPASSRSLETHFSDTIGTIVYFHRDAELLDNGPARLRQGGVPVEGLRAVLAYEETFAGSRRRLGSELYLFRRGAYFVKFRHSYPLENRQSVQPELIRLMEALDWSDAGRALAVLANWSL